MKILKIRCRSLHGSMNLDVKFHEKLNLLVGINGCGKTSVLNAIEWLLQKDLYNLSNNRFSLLSVTFAQTDVLYRLEATKDEKELLLTLYNSDQNEVLYDPIKVDLVKFPELTQSAAQALGPDPTELPLWTFLTGLPKLTVVSLDRTITAEIADVRYIEHTHSYEAWESGRDRTPSPMEYVEKVTSEAFAEYRKLAIANDSELKSQIVMSSLQSPSDETAQGEDQNVPLDPAAAQQLEETVVDFLSKTIQHKGIEKKARSFFQYITDLSESAKAESDSSSEFQTLVRSQYARVFNLATAFKGFESANRTAFEDLRKYLDCVNGFFKDSGKSLYFDDSTGRLFFDYTQSGNERPLNRKIANLSSGEKQILTIFTLVAFLTEPDSVFVVDEPELSLHPKWQYEFLDALLSISPNRTQLMLATHSPDIVGSHRASCVNVGAHK